MTTPFWSNDPTILFNKEYIFELMPSSTMSFERKSNALSRTIILLTIIGFVLTLHLRMIFIGAATLMLIMFLYKMRKYKIINSLKKKEGFSANGKSRVTTSSGDDDSGVNEINGPNNGPMTTNPITLESVLKSNYYNSNKKNPLGNVLLPEITYNPNRKSAPPAFNPDVHMDINASAKKTIQYLNPGIKNTNKQLFGDLWQNYDFENSSMRQFFSTANTKVANDQGSFAQYLYGGMISGKESDQSGALARVQDNPRYIMM